MTKKKYILDGVKVDIDLTDGEILEVARKKLRASGVDGGSYDISLYKKSIDARRRDEIKFVCSFTLTPKNNKAIRLRGDSLKLRELDAEAFLVGKINPVPNLPPLVVGMGPAGLFSALLLAEYGYKPIIIDRGDSICNRVAVVDRFYSTGMLDTESNIQFGAGGAGTFSDGKLLTRINDPLVNYVLERLHSFGAPDEIMTKAKPHIGTDKLRLVVQNLLDRIESLGGKVIYRCKLEDVEEKCEGIVAHTTKGDFLCSSCVLALGHSARDTYKTLLENNFVITPKPFSVGVRIEHLREDIERGLYGKFAGHKNLGAAEYALSDTSGDRGVYTFCMCPGGEVMAATSEEGGVVVNGMSHYARDGRNSNSAIAVSVKLSDIEKHDGSDVLGAIEFQRKIERAAFSAGGGDYSCPLQTVGDFLGNKKGTAPTRVTPTYMGGNKYKLAEMDGVLPDFVCERLRFGISAFDRKIRGFAADDAILLGAETRTSSPLRIMRGEDMQAIGKKNIYPCGEGAGYAGGITSAAVDGVKVALAILQK